MTTPPPPNPLALKSPTSRRRSYGEGPPSPPPPRTVCLNPCNFVHLEEQVSDDHHGMSTPPPSSLPSSPLCTPPIYLCCFVQLEEELQSTSSRADTMNGVVAALPSEGDISRMRAYNWQDVQDLQEVRKIKNKQFGTPLGCCPIFIQKCKRRILSTTTVNFFFFLCPPKVSTFLGGVHTTSCATKKLCR